MWDLRCGAAAHKESILTNRLIRYILTNWFSVAIFLFACWLVVCLHVRNASALNAIALSCTHFLRIFISSENNFSVSVNATHGINFFFIISLKNDVLIITATMTGNDLFFV